MRKLDYEQFLPVPNNTGKLLHKTLLFFFTFLLFGNPVVEASSFFSFNFSKAVTCKSVQSAYPYNPVNETNSFKTGETPHVWVELTNVYGKVQGRFEWYRPDGSLHHTSTTGVFNVNNGGWARMHAAQNLYNFTGKWRVKCYISHNGGGYYQQKELHFVYGDCPCAAIYEPVCGSDGQTYANPCKATCAGVSYTHGECNTGPSCDLLARINLNPDLCSQCLSEVAVYEYYGQTYLVKDGRNSGCSDAISTVLNCDSGATYCQQGGIAGFSCGNFFDVATKVEVVLTDDCNQGCFCPQNYDPVCGSDGNTYGNSCEAECAGVYTWTHGECSPEPSCDLLTRITFNSDLCSQCLSEIAVYEYYGQTYLVQDGRNSGCSDALTTVLDCNSGGIFCRDGGIAGYSCGNFFDIATKVEVVLSDDCEQGCFCPQNYAPVCGSDGNTYGNSCEAECAGVYTWTTGECNQACVCTNSHADYICDDFQSYDPWQKLGPQSSCWTTWTGAQGGSEDGIVQRNNTTQNQYLRVKGNHTNEKPQDVVLKLGDKTSGKYTLKFQIWVFAGDKGYYNVLHRFNENSTHSNQWASQVYFDEDGSGHLLVKNTAHHFTYKMGEWVDVEQHIDLHNDLTDLYIGGHHVHSWNFSAQSTRHEAGTRQLSAISFHAVDSDYEYYIDDIELSKTAHFTDIAEERSKETVIEKENIIADDLKVSPNPFNATLAITIPETMSNASIAIIDQYGRTVKTKENISSEVSQTVNMDVQELPRGIYYVRVASEGQILTEKVVKSE